MVITVSDSYCTKEEGCQNVCPARTPLDIYRCSDSLTRSGAWLVCSGKIIPLGPRLYMTFFLQFTPHTMTARTNNCVEAGGRLGRFHGRSCYGTQVEASSCSAERALCLTKMNWEVPILSRMLMVSLQSSQLIYRNILHTS